MLQRVAVEREAGFVDVLVDFVSDLDPSWPDLIEARAAGTSIRVRLRMHPGEIETLAVALDGAVTGSDGELYFRPE
jgi:hypothetical protein